MSSTAEETEEANAMSVPPISAAAAMVDKGKVSAARNLWQSLEAHAQQVASKPKRSSLQLNTDTLFRSQKAAARFAKFDLRNEIARVLGDPKKIELNLSNNSQFSALSAEQKARARPTS